MMKTLKEGDMIEIIEKILTHLDKKGATAEVSRLPPCRAHAPSGPVRLEAITQR